MTLRLLGYDPLTGLKTFHDYDEATDTTFLHHTQDVQPILDANKRAANDASGPLGEMVRVASIPAVVQLEWLKRGVDLYNPDHKQGVAKLLDDPEWRYLKVRNIILGRF